jgi:hypothetical protein
MKKTTVLQTAFGLAIMLCGFVSTAHATMGLKLFDGAGNCVEVSVGAAATACGGGATSGSGNILSAVTTPAGEVQVNASLGGWIVNVTTGETKPLIGSALSPEMDVSTIDNYVAGPGTSGVLTIQWSDQGFVFHPGQADATAGGTANNANKVNKITYSTFTDTTNALYGMNDPMTTATWPPFSFGCAASSALACPFDNQTIGGVINTQPYSMTQELVFNVNGTTSLSGDFHVNIVPEPASVALLGGIVLLTATAIRRRSKRA